MSDNDGKPELTIYMPDDVTHGRHFANPGLYFEWLKDAPVKLLSEWTPGPCIVANVLLSDQKIMDQLTAIDQSRHPAVFWGIGLDEAFSNQQNFPKFESALVGWREAAALTRSDHYFAPCPSCLNLSFECIQSMRTIRHDDFYRGIYQSVIYEECSDPISTQLEVSAPALDTRFQTSNLFQVLAFLSTGRLVITNNYRGVYWSLLIDGKPIIFEPDSNWHLAIPGVPVCDRHSYAEVTRQALEQPYPAHLSLAQMRAATQDFAKRAKYYLRR